MLVRAPCAGRRQPARDLGGADLNSVATSVPDLFVSVRAARKGEGTVSLANVLGSNIYDLLHGLDAWTNRWIGRLTIIVLFIG
ncbi:MAG: hypothetical protein ACLFNA_06380 [Halochromatium sp.]